MEFVAYVDMVCLKKSRLKCEKCKGCSDEYFYYYECEFGSPLSGILGPTFARGVRVPEYARCIVGNTYTLTLSLLPPNKVGEKLEPWVSFGRY